MKATIATTAAIVGGVASPVIDETLPFNIAFAVLGWAVSCLGIPTLNDKVDYYPIRKIAVFFGFTLIAAFLIHATYNVAPQVNFAPIDAIIRVFWQLPENARCFAAGYFITLTVYLPTPERALRHLIIFAKAKKGGAK